MQCLLVCFFNFASYYKYCPYDLDAGKDSRQKEKTATEDETVGWRHCFNEHELAQTPRGGEGQGNLACCSHGVAKSRTRLGGLNNISIFIRNFRHRPSPILLLLEIYDYFLLIFLLSS